MGRKVLGTGGIVMLPAGVFTLTGRDAADEVRAAAKQRNQSTGLLLRRIHTMARVTAEGGMREGSDRFSGDEVAAMLGWSSSVAGRWVELADDLVLRLPKVLAAMETGALEETKARVFSEWTRDLSGEHAAMVADLLLDHAPQMPTGALIEAVVANAIALDPDFAKRREARARKRARVVGSVMPDGTASLSGHDLPLEKTVAALSRVEAIADRVRARGVDMPIGVLKSTVFLRLLGPLAAGLDEAALVEALVEELRDDDGPDVDGPDDNGPDDGPQSDGPLDGGSPDDGPDGSPEDGPDDGDPAGDSDDDGSSDDGPGDGSPHDEGDAPAATRDPDLDAPDPETGADAARESGESSEAPEDSEPAPPTRGVRRGVTELRVGLATLLGLDDRPGHLTTWGPLLAPRARDWAADQPHAEWRVVVVDDQGRLLHVMLTRHRPPPTSSHGRRGTRGIIEIQVTWEQLMGLDPARFPAWAGLLTDAQGRLARLPADGCPDRRPDAADAAGRRRARADLDRWIRVRDRYCAMPGCRRPAQVCDLDHTKAWSEYGPSAAWNLGALCRRHHRTKHLGGWALRQLDAGEFLWRTRAGMTYLVGARPIVEHLPDPVAPAHGRRRRLSPARGCPPDRRGLGGTTDRRDDHDARERRDVRVDPPITYVGNVRRPVFDEEPPF